MKIPKAFHFRVVFHDMDPEGIDTGFLSVQGLEIFFELADSVNAGGPKGITALFPPLVLTRAVKDRKDSPLSQWLFNAIRQKKVTQLSKVTIQVLDDEHQPQLFWDLADVTPKSWRLSSLDAVQSNTLLETIELTYARMSFGPDDPPEK